MGTCLSKKGSSSSSSSNRVSANFPTSNPSLEEQKKAVKAVESVKKEIFVIKQRQSHERHLEEKGAGRNPNTDEICIENKNPNSDNGAIIAPLRAMSCTEGGIDAVLIQNSSLKTGFTDSSDKNCNPHCSFLGISRTRKHSDSNTSYDFDHDDSNNGKIDKGSGDNDEEEENQVSQNCQFRSFRRRSLSRERSGSRDRSSSRGEEERRRRISHSPGKRSESPISTAIIASAPDLDKSKPGKMVSVPATASNARDKNNISAIPESTMAIKRVLVKRNVEIGNRGSASSRARSQSPANNARVSIENAHHQHHQPSCSNHDSLEIPESSSYRRNPLNEICENSLRNNQISFKARNQVNSNNKLGRKKQVEEGMMKKSTPSQSQLGLSDEINNRATELPQRNTNYNSSTFLGEGEEMNVYHCSSAKEKMHTEIFEEPKDVKEILSEPSKIAVEIVETEGSSLKTNTKNRSFTRFRDLDLELSIEPDPNSYTSLLLEDIRKFHRRNSTACSLPPCVTKAYSILDAMGDLNSCSSSNISSVFSDDRCYEADQSSNNTNKNISSNTYFGKKILEAKDPFVESEMVSSKEVMEPGFHKYVTVRRRGGDIEQQESSGSNGLFSQNWISSSSSSSSWEPNSSSSTDFWNSISKNGKVGNQTISLLEDGDDFYVRGRRLRRSGNNTLSPML